MLGLPHQHVHLEITKHEEEDSLPVPHPEQLLVFYIPDAEEFQQMKKRLLSFGGRHVTSTNPYWDRGGATIEDRWVSSCADEHRWYYTCLKRRPLLGVFLC